MDKIFKSQKRLKKYNLNRLAAWLLAVLMLFSALPTGNITVQAETTTNVARIGSNNYTSWEEAIEAANDEDIITLLANIDLGAEDIAPNKDITIDLNGYSLKAVAFNAFEKTEVIDTSVNKAGVLKVTNFIPAASNSQMPIYNGTDGYVFATVQEQVHRSSEMGADTFKLIFKPYFGTATINELLKGGGDAAKVSIWIRLEWTDAEGESQSKELKYTDEMVKEVYAGTNKAFYIEASGADQFDDLTITPLIKSNMGEYPEWSDSVFDCGGFGWSKLKGNNLPNAVAGIGIAYKTSSLKDGQVAPTASDKVLANEASGKSCIHFDITSAGSGTEKNPLINALSVYTKGDGFTIEPGTYEVGFKAKLVDKETNETDKTLAVNVCRLHNKDKYSTNYANDLNFTITESSKWTTYEGKFVVPEGKTDAKLQIQMGGDGTEKVDLYMADFYLIKVEE